MLRTWTGPAPPRQAARHQGRGRRAGGEARARADLTAVAVLTGAVAHGPVRCHGDLDREGVRIAAHLVRLCGVRPWRMTIADHEGHLWMSGSTGCSRE